jgi:hypothetical protein
MAHPRPSFTEPNVHTILCVCVCDHFLELDAQRVHHLNGAHCQDMLETGRSLAVAQSYLDDNKGAAEVLTACLYTMDISEVRPDFFLRQVDQVVRGSTAVCRHFSLCRAHTRCSKNHIRSYTCTKK